MTFWVSDIFSFLQVQSEFVTFLNLPGWKEVFIVKTYVKNFSPICIYVMENCHKSQRKLFFCTVIKKLLENIKLAKSRLFRYDAAVEIIFYECICSNFEKKSWYRYRYFFLFSLVKSTSLAIISILNVENNYYYDYQKK